MAPNAKRCRYVGDAFAEAMSEPLDAFASIGMYPYHYMQVVGHDLFGTNLCAWVTGAEFIDVLGYLVTKLGEFYPGLWKAYGFCRWGRIDEPAQKGLPARNRKGEVVNTLTFP